MLDMYKKMVSKYKKRKRITRDEYDSIHNYNTETGDASYDKE